MSPHRRERLVLDRIYRIYRIFVALILLVGECFLTEPSDRSVGRPSLNGEAPSLALPRAKGMHRGGDRSACAREAAPP